MTSMSSVADPVVVHTRPVLDLDDEQFFAFCQLNPELRIERDCKGDIQIMAPAAGSSGRRNFRLATLFGIWEQRAGGGMCFDSSTGFILPNGATRSPDIAWVSQKQLDRLSADQWERFLPLCPDFVLELRSPTDGMAYLQAKMQEYISNDAQLGWLIDPATKSVFIYQPGQDCEHIRGEKTISGEPVLVGFTLNLAEIWDALES